VTGRQTSRPVGYVLGGGASLGGIQIGMLQALAQHDLSNV
jgi:NTE family protein